MVGGHAEAGIPTLALGGADPRELRIDHDVAVDPVTGRAAITVPLALTSGPDGFGPVLSLRYDSTAAHSPFGTGWSMDGPAAITVSGRQGVPHYDARDSYVFSLGGELVPVLRLDAGDWLPRVDDRPGFTVWHWRPRVDTAHIRVEQWIDKTTSRVHWRTRDVADVLTVYGLDPAGASRIADPDDPTRVHAWLPDAQYHPNGRAIRFEYAAETLDGVDRGSTFERSRVRPALAQRYLKRVQYANSVPVLPDSPVPAGLTWRMEVVFDYGDYDETPRPAPDHAWPARPDAHSVYRAGFEIRTYRLCRR
ncbi:MAG: SpvB/TcaC N-terminal domain-containing protein, partial [Micromonosporaceae bacterium]